MNKDTKFSTGEMGDTAFADALMGALQKKTEKENVVKENVVKNVVAATAPALPDLNEIKVEEVVIPTLRDAEAKIKEEVDASKQWAEAAGAKVAQLDENLEKIQIEIKKVEERTRKESDFLLSGTLKSLLVELKKAEKKELTTRDRILAGSNDTLKQHVEFSRFLEEIRGADHSHLGEVREIWDQVHQKELRKLLSKEQLKNHKFPQKMGPIFFEGKISVPISGSDGQKALEAELRKLIDAAKFSKAASIKACGNADLTGFKSGKPGTYYFFSPKRTEKSRITEGGVEIPERKFFEGHALVELRDINKGKFDIKDGKKVFRKPYVVVEVRDAIGSLARLVSDRWIPHFWINEGRVISKDRLEEDDFLHAINVIKTLRAIFVIWQEGLNPKPETGKAEVSPIEGPAVNAVVDTDMTGIVVEKKPAAAKPEKTEKSKKVKKTTNPNEEVKQVGRLW